MKEQEIKEEVTEEVKENKEKAPEMPELKKEAKANKKKEKEHKKIDKEKDELIKANLEFKEKNLRLSAEMQNMRRRFDIDLANAHKYEGLELINKLLPIVDNFERAMQIKVEGTEKFLDGFKMIYNNLIDALKSTGVVEIEAINKAFDPNVMNAIATEGKDDIEENTVVEVLQKGYMYKDKLLRASMVKVSTKKENESE